MKKKKIASGKVDINHLSVLANIPISTKEKKALKEELEKTISYIEVLNELNTQKTAPIFQTTKLKNITRQDILEKSLNSKEILKNAAKTRGCYFVAKKVKWE